MMVDSANYFVTKRKFTFADIKEEKAKEISDEFERNY